MVPDLITCTYIMLNDSRMLESSQNVQKKKKRSHSAPMKLCTRERHNLQNRCSRTENGFIPHVPLLSQNLATYVTRSTT